MQLHRGGSIEGIRLESVAGLRRKRDPVTQIALLPAMTQGHA
jgi:hypothetical protein